METGNHSQHILVVEDDQRTRELLRSFLGREQFHCSTAADATEAKNLLGYFRFDLVIADVMMPGQDGISLTSEIQETLGIPVIILSALGGSDKRRMEGLGAGADDYVSKPFNPDEIVMRINNILKRIKGSGRKMILMDDLAYDPLRKELTRNGVVVSLTDSENRVLHKLALRVNQTVSRMELAEDPECGGPGHSDRSVDIAVSRLRRKIERDSRTPRYLKTVRNQGYILVPDAQTQ